MVEFVEKSCLFIINTLYHQSVYCIILFLFIIGISFLLREKSPHWQIGLWFLILIRLVLPTDLNLHFSARNLAENFIATDNLNIPIKALSDKLDIRDRMNHILSSNVSPNIEGHEIYMQSSKHLDGGKKYSVHWPVVLAVTWFLGCLIFMALFLNKISGINRVLKHSSLVKDEGIIALAEYWKQKFKVKRSVKIFSSEKFLSPFTVGILRPRIFIPAPFLENKDNETINSIIAHEMVHIKRFDHAWIRMQNILQVIYFFNPVIWYANRQINIARERVCDSIVLSKKVIKPEAFGRSVIDAIRVNVFGRTLLYSLLGFSNHKKILEYRIKDILKENTMTKQKTVFIFIMVCLLGLFLLPMSSGKTVTNKPVTKVEDNEIKPTSSLVENYEEVYEAITSTLQDENQQQEQIIVSSVSEISNPVVSTETAKKVGQTQAGNNRSSSDLKGATHRLLLTQSNKSENLPEKTISISEGEKTEKKMIVSDEAQERDRRTVSHANNGFDYSKKLQFDSAISEFSKAIELNPDVTLCYFGRGQAYMAKNRMDKAIPDFSKTIELFSTYADAYVMRGIAYSILGQSEDAMKDFNKAIEINPEYADAYYYRGTEYFKVVEKRVSKAYLYPESGAGFNNKETEIKVSKALSSFNRAVEINPEYLNAIIMRAYCYRILRDYKKVRLEYSRALALNPEPSILKAFKRIILF